MHEFYRGKFSSPVFELNKFNLYAYLQLVGLQVQVVGLQVQFVVLQVELLGLQVQLVGLQVVTLKVLCVLTPELHNALGSGR